MTFDRCRHAASRLECSEREAGELLPHG